MLTLVLTFKMKLQSYWAFSFFGIWRHNFKHISFSYNKADETTDASNTAQVTLFLHWVTDDLQVHEDFVGL